MSHFRRRPRRHKRRLHSQYFVQKRFQTLTINPHIIKKDKEKKRIFLKSDDRLKPLIFDNVEKDDIIVKTEDGKARVEIPSDDISAIFDGEGNLVDFHYKDKQGKSWKIPNISSVGAHKKIYSADSMEHPAKNASCIGTGDDSVLYEERRNYT